MSITFQLVLAVIVGFIVLNSVLTLIFGTVSWLIDRYRWKAWTILGLCGLIIIGLLYINLGDIVGRMLTMIQ